MISRTFSDTSTTNRQYPPLNLKPQPINESSTLMTINPPIHKKRNLLGEAQGKKRDEFYTQLRDIEKELILYKEHFRNKVVYCNCDDPLWSNFFLFFVLNFNSLGLRGLIATCYSGSLSSDKALKAVVRHVPEHLIPADYDAGLDDTARFINEPQGKRRGKTANVESPPHSGF